MKRLNAGKGKGVLILLLLTTIGILFLEGIVLAGQKTATWVDGNPSQRNWSNKNNWDLKKVPDNDVDTYSVLIGGTSFYVNLNQNATIDNLTNYFGNTLDINNAKTLGIAGGPGKGLITNNGSILLNSSGSATYLQLQSGNVTLSGTGTLTLGNNTNNIITGTNSAYILTNAAGHTIQGVGNIGNNNIGVTNNGTIIANQSNALNISPGSSGFINNGTLRANSGSTLHVTNDFTNAGTITGESNSILRIKNGIGTLTSTGTISGKGEIQGNVINSGIVSPGSSPGIETITGDYVQDPSGLLLIEIAGYTQGTEYDVLNITGTATLSGTLDVDLLSDFIPTNGSSFTFLTAANGITGTFTTLNLPVLPEGNNWNVIYGSNDVRLSVAPEPVSAILFVSGVPVLALWRRYRLKKNGSPADSNR